MSSNVESHKDGDIHTVAQKTHMFIVSTEQYL